MSQSATGAFILPSHHLKKRLRPWFILGTLLLFAAILTAPVPEGLTREGLNAIAIFVLCVIFWVSNAIPLMITSLMAIILLPLLGVIESDIAYSLFGNQAVFFILGAFILASAMMQSGLSTRIALGVLKYFDKTQTLLLLGLLILPAGMSFIMSEHAVAAMMLPIVLEISVALELETGSKFGLALFLAAAWGAIIGGIGTFLGGARAILAVGILEETTGETIGFLEWVFAALPTVVIMLGVAFVMLLWISRSENHSVVKATEHLQNKVAELGVWSGREKGIALLMFVTIILWLTAGHALGLANIALGAVVVAFIFKLLSWKQVEKDVNWGIILMYGGAIALGFALDYSGAAAWLADIFLANWVTSAFSLIVVLSIITKVLTEGISNTAVVALMMPIAIALTLSFDMDPKIATLALAIPSGLAFMLPISTPATAIAISSKYVTTADTMRTGLILNLVSVAVFILVAVVYWPLIGFTL